MENRYRELFDEVHASQRLKTEVLNMKHTQKRTVSRRKIPAALAAACLCLALAGTALAARYFGVQIVEGSETDTMDVWMEGSVTCYPVELLSDELRALENEHKFVRFDSWQEAEDFIGVTLMNNPVLDAFPSKDYYVKCYDGKDQRVSGQFILTTSIGLDHVRLHGCYEMGHVNISVQGFLFTDRTEKKVEDWSERYYGLGFPEEPKPTMNIEGLYTTPNGLEAQIMTFEYGSGRNECLAAFSLEGFPFIVSAKSYDSLEEAHEALLQVLDGFVLE